MTCPRQCANQEYDFTNQPIPIYRLMKKTHIEGALVGPYNEYEKNRYIKYW